MSREVMQQAFDALVLNAAYALCGPCGTVTPNAALRSGEAVPLESTVMQKG